MSKEWKNTFRVGKFKVAMTYQHGGGIRAVWDPFLPTRLSKKQWRQYCAGRDALVAEVACAFR
jgi:hypothetical protein